MKFLLSLALALLMTAALAAKPSVTASVRPLTYPNEEGVRYNGCTTFSLRTASGRSVWMTAAHCVIGGAEFDGHKLAIVAVDFTADLAAVVGPPAPGLSLSQQDNPTLGEITHAVGYPLGWTVPFMASGHVGAVKFHQDSWGERSFNLFDMTIGPGMSGGPILDKDDMVIGLCQIAVAPFSPYFAIVSGGASAGDIRTFLNNVPN